MKLRFWGAILSLGVLSLAATSHRSAAHEEAAPSGGSEGTPVLLTGLGDFHRKITTNSEESQRYFDQGRVLLWAFDHEAAIRSFQHVVEVDPGCAMAWWGIAFAAGPNYNNPAMDDAANALACSAVTAAKANVAGSTDVEKALVRALETRYLDPAPEDRTPLDGAFADAMREVWHAHPQDADVGAWFAEALMDTRPWDLWSVDGEPRPETPEILETLEAVLALDPRHPLANHLYIHALEASTTPGKAEAAADRLTDLVPGSGHLVHMPSHIYIRLGRYEDAIVANQKGIAADLEHVKETGADPFYTIYRAHNYHFLAYAAMFEGRRAVAMEAARNLRAEIPDELVRAIPDFLDAFVAVPYHVMIRFGLWEDVLAEPAPPADFPVSTAFHHYARTVAFAATGRVKEAEAERALLEAAFANVPESALIGNNTALVVLELARPMADGEIEYRKGNYEVAFANLREAVRRDDELRYDEPWGWMQPTRHALGALLLEQGRLEEAEAVYRKDLQLHANNGWALHGLAQCLEKAGKKDEAATVNAQFEKSWKRSDILIRASCYCATGA
jgi:tetratricopeptide (TPR) repeat protein